MTAPQAAAGFQPLTPERWAELRRQVGEEAVLGPADDLERFSRDATEAYRFLPEAVVLPTETDQVSAVLRFASQHRIPITPRGAGTGLSGGALAVHGGIVLSLERMNRIRSIDPRNLTAVVEAGVVTGDFQERVEAEGLFYPPDPASRDSCCLGGNLAEDSAGPRSCKYGSTRKWVLGLEAVLADGSVVSTGGANRKDVAGYNLTQLLVGSEGTLAVITAATLRLIAKPRYTLTLALPFPRLEQAAAAVEGIFREGFDPSACELLEERAIALVERIHPVPKALQSQGALLVLELDGQDPDRLLEEAAALGSWAESQGAGEVLVAQDAKEQRRLWQVRRKIGEALAEYSVFKSADTVVPRSRLVEVVEAAREVGQKHELEVVSFGHAGDGNLHINLLQGNLSDQSWRQRRDAAETDLFAAVVALGGSVTAEHGVGWTQRRHLAMALDPALLNLSRRLKDQFDPLGILNPGKIFLSAR